ncbi:hypothetical protein K438DRAFT_1965353 [Mycena galopus ATCC 62051]|nr:hypothetical protein K438DRAFT_1965353 [Mycena galopus ATCC 62051]
MHICAQTTLQVLDGGFTCAPFTFPITHTLAVSADWRTEAWRALVSSSNSRPRPRRVARRMPRWSIDLPPHPLPLHPHPRLHLRLHTSWRVPAVFPILAHTLYISVPAPPLPSLETIPHFHPCPHPHVRLRLSLLIPPIAIAKEGLGDAPCSRSLAVAPVFSSKKRKEGRKGHRARTHPHPPLRIPRALLPPPSALDPLTINEHPAVKPRPAEASPAYLPPFLLDSARRIPRSPPRMLPPSPLPRRPSLLHSTGRLYAGYAPRGVPPLGLASFPRFPLGFIRVIAWPSVLPPRLVRI